jgi:hypothetical protein
MNPLTENRHLLTDDGEFAEPVPLTDSTDEQDPRVKPKPVPDSRLFLPRWQPAAPAFSVPTIIRSVLGFGLLLLMVSLGVAPCLLFLTAGLLIVGLMIMNNQAAQLGRDGIGRLRRRLPAYRDPWRHQ